MLDEKSQLLNNLMDEKRELELDFKKEKDD